MPYVDQNLRFILDKSNIKPLRRRSEGRLKTYGSNEDLRSWNFTVDDRRRQILDVVRSDIEKCGQLSTEILHALCQRSKAELAKNLKELWDFLMSRNLTPEEKEHLQQLQKQMGYVCMQAIKDCTCIGDYELVCVCDDESGTKHKNLLLDVVDIIEQKLDSNKPVFENNLPKEKKPCACTNASGIEDPNIMLRTGKIEDTSVVEGTPDSKKQPNCHPSCIRFKANSNKEGTSVVEGKLTSEGAEKSTIGDVEGKPGSKKQPTCHPSCIRFKANSIKPRTTEKTVVSTAEKGVRSAVSTSNVVCQCDADPTKKPTSKTEPDIVNKRIGKNKPVCQCDKATSTFPSPPGKTRSVKVGVLSPGTKQQDEIAKVDCKQDMDEFEKELHALNRGTICPEMEANMIKRELDILKKYCMKLKAAEEENERLRREQNASKRQERLQPKAATRLNEESKECEKCADLTNKVKTLEDRLAKCTNTLPEDLEIYKNRSALIDTTLAERDEMQRKMEQVNEMQSQLIEYKKKAARADELEDQLRKLQKDKSSTYEINKIQSKCLCVQRELENLRAERNAIQKRLDLMKDEVECLKAKAKEAEVLAVERDKLQIKLNDLAHVQVHNDNLRLKCKCLENSANERDMYKQRYESQLNMERENETLKSQIEAAAVLKRERDCLKRQLADLQSCIVDQENEIKRLMQQIDNLIKNKDDIQSRMKDALATMRAEIEKKDELIASAEKKLEKMQSELKTSIQGVSCETSCYKARIEELESELKEAKGKIAELEKTSTEKQDSIRNNKDCQFAALCSMKRELHAANVENKKLEEIADNMAILTGDEHVQKMLRQSECAIRKVIQELSKQYREWDELKKERRKPKSESSPRTCNKKEIARYEGCGFITVDCTSHYTACAAKKLGFDLHYTLNYEDYKVDGEVVFKPAPPHKALTVYTQRIF